MSGTENSTLMIDITVQSGAWPDTEQLEPLIEAWIMAALTQAGQGICEGSELSVVLTDDDAIRALNRTYRGKDTPTNVLSFPGSDPGSGPFGPLLGDIVISLETTTWEAKTEKKPFERHLAHLIIHGLLHLFGYDHGNDTDAERMERLETAILADLGIPDPYAVPAP